MGVDRVFVDVERLSIEEVRLLRLMFRDLAEDPRHSSSVAGFYRQLAEAFSGVGDGAGVGLADPCGVWVPELGRMRGDVAG